MAGFLSDWEVPELEVPDLSMINPKPRIQENLFGEKKRKAWHEQNAMEARCDLKPCIRLTKRGVFFISVWKKSLFGRTLVDLKSDRAMVDVFASSIVPVIRGVVGQNLDPTHFALVCSPRRRHLEWNFGHATAEAVAIALGIPFFPDCCTAKSRQRVNVEFDPANVPPQKNLIIYDDIVTTGQTLSSMERLFNNRLGKNCIFFANINNKL